MVSLKKLDKILEKLDTFEEKKPWVKVEQINDVREKISETKIWIEE